MNRKVFRILATLFCFGVLAVTSGTGLAKAAPLPRVVYGFDREFPPFSFEDHGGQEIGFEVELLKAILSGVATVVPRPLQWEHIPVELSAGTITVTSGMIQTQERSKLYLFPKEINFPLQIRMFTKTYHRFPNLTFLRGQRVAVEQGSYQHRMLERFGGINVKTFSDKVSPIKALYNDEVNAYCGPVQSAYYFMNKLNYGGITTMGTPMSITNLRFAVNRDRGDVLRMINTGFARVLANGEYDRIYKKWFVRELTADETADLVDAAKSGAQASYAPYSLKQGGGAVLTATGKIYYGSRVENADGKLTLSGVAAAIANATSAGDIELRAAVSVDGDGNIVPATSAELQLLNEFGRGVLVVSQRSGAGAKMVGELLPKPVTRKPAFAIQ